MTLDEVLASLFPAGHAVRAEAEGRIAGHGVLSDGRRLHVLGLAGGVPLGVDAALVLAGQVLAVAGQADDTGILMLIDSSSQRMSRRDELLGLNEYLAHLAKALLLAEQAGHRTFSLLYGGSAAGAFIATALATSVLVALPDAHPEVMDLPSMARVTKLSLEVLTEKAKTTPVFAPGLDNLARTGAIQEIWDPDRLLAGQLEALLSRPAVADMRDVLGRTRQGRPKAAAIAGRVADLAAAGDA
jgi:malonate decarboxylase gamma subunit